MLPAACSLLLQDVVVSFTWCRAVNSCCTSLVLQVLTCRLHLPGRWDAEEVEKLTTAVAASLERRALRVVEGVLKMTIDGIEWKWVGEQVGTRGAYVCQRKW